MLSLSPAGNLKLTINTAAGTSMEYIAVLPLVLDSWTHVAAGFDSQSQEASFLFNGKLIPHTAPLIMNDVSLFSFNS